MTREQLLASIRKQFGEQSMFLLGREERLLNIPVRSSGSLQLDYALGGGYPHGRVIELRGPEGSGKTTLANLAIAEAQQREPDKENAVIDLENTYNLVWAKTLGVDVDRLFVSQPDTYAEKVYELIEYLLRTGRFSYIVLDSVAGLVTKEEFESADWDKESRVGGASKLNSKAMRKLVNSGLLAQSGTTLLFINQLRDKIGAFSMYGTPTDTTGGRSLKHNYTIQLDVSKGELFKKGTGQNAEYIGQQLRVKVAKNKIAPPFRTACLDIYYEYGLDKINELVLFAKEIGVLSGSSWLRLVDITTGDIQTDENGQEIKFNGVQKAKEAIAEDLAKGGNLYNRIYDLVQTALRG